jgi:phosphoglycerate dehydrogenase-like enzyme
MSDYRPDIKIGVAIHQPLRDQLFTRADQRRLESLGGVTWAQQTRPLNWDEAAALLRDCRIALGGWGTPPLGTALLEACPRLELWEHVAGSVKHLFGPHLNGRRLTIASCKPALADVVAEMTLAEIILGLRGVFENAAGNRQRVVPQPTHSRVLLGSTIGIVGASLIGRRVIGLLRPFGCRVIVYDPYLSGYEAEAMGVERVSDLKALCARCDVVSLHTPDVPETAGIMGAAEFAAMRDDAIFINTARGRCVDEAALIAQLAQGRLFAILDVSEPEPPAPDSPFRSLPNVVYTSHIGGPACPNLGAQAVDDIAAYLSGGCPQYVVTPDMLAITA